MTPREKAALLIRILRGEPLYTRLVTIARETQPT
jgi:hypothetical protein